MSRNHDQDSFPKMVFDEFSSMLLTTLGFFAPFGLTMGVVFFRLLVDFSSSSSSGRTLVGLTVVKTKFFVVFLAKRSSVAASRPRNDPRWLLVNGRRGKTFDLVGDSADVFFVFFEIPDLMVLESSLLSAF